MAQVETQMVYPESPMDQEEVFCCRGCGSVLEEGKAFELGGNRWHLECFRCGTCGNLLDTESNLLLLGDGSLLCHNCTYSCSTCGNKIEDLAILTGDQAFCSSCFRCRNCKKKIENLRYARTSQGIFCMSCHEMLMARRRKKSRKAPSGQAKEKALPSLPADALPPSHFSPDAAELDTPPSTGHSGTPTARSPSQRLNRSRGDDQTNYIVREPSPLSENAPRDGPTLPASTYGEPRPSNVSHESDDGFERGFLPMQFDPNPISGPPPGARNLAPQSYDRMPPTQGESRPRDYFGGLSAKAGNRDVLREDSRPGSSRSASTEREPERLGSQPRASPHILYQDKGRQNKTSETSTPASMSAAASPLASGVEVRGERLKPQQLDARGTNMQESFKLQEAPKAKKAGSRSSKEAKSPIMGNDEVLDKGFKDSPASTTSPSSSINPFDDPKRKDGFGLSSASQATRPVRQDSLASAARKAKPSPPETQRPAATTTATVPQLQPEHERSLSGSSVPSSFADAQSTLSRDNSVSKPVESPPTQISPEVPPPRSSSRQATKSIANDDFTTPRAPPPPPASAPIAQHKKSGSTSNGLTAGEALSPALYSAGLPRQSAEAPFSMEEEMSRILKGDAKAKQGVEGPSPSVLRKMSNAVKHGRSFSDRTIGTTGRPAVNGGMEISSPMVISSPMMSSPPLRENSEQYAANLKRAQQRIAELESEVNRLEDKVNSSSEIKAANNELREKRTTIVVLDTQREMVIRELETMTEHLTKAKESNQPLEMSALKSDVLKDFAESLQALKDRMGAQIEELMRKRNELTDEIGNLIQMKDKGFQEYESLSNKNAQLQEHNNQLLNNIQDVYKSNRGMNGAAPSANGLGIYHSSGAVETPGPTDVRNLNLVNTDSSMPNLLQETEAEPATVLTAPQVVNIRKGQPKKFNWRKGGERVAKNVTKGIKGAFASERGPAMREGEVPYSIGVGGLPYNQTQAVSGSEQGSVSSRPGLDPSRSGSSFGLFSQKPGATRPGGSMKDNSSTNLAIDPSVLFGSELTERCEYEKRLIPGIVSRCIDEVETRGMDVEGIYRKSGGSGQVKLVQQGFEKDNNHDISDLDLDIHAVTSALKQYFRKLPVPLITYDAYDSLLEAGRIQDKEKQAASLQMVVAELPEHHRDCLEFLVQHLARVMAQEAENLMTPLNLAVVFAPTIMRPLSIEREMSDMQAQRIAVQALLEQNKAVFPEE